MLTPHQLTSTVQMQFGSRNKLSNWTESISIRENQMKKSKNKEKLGNAKGGKGAELVQR
jgi:hypothetical protein